MSPVGKRLLTSELRAAAIRAGIITPGASGTEDES